MQRKSKVTQKDSTGTQQTKMNKKGEKYYEFDERETGCVLRNDGQRTR